MPMVSCGRAPHLVEYDNETNLNARSAPLVVVGVTDSDTSIGRTVPSRRDPNYPMLLHRVRIQIENVLRGSVRGRTLFAYYFGFAGGINGPRPLGFWGTPSRHILWLRQDSDAMRLACDGWDYCTMPVMSGAHPDDKRDPTQPLDSALSDILLTRGDGKIDDLRFASEITWGTPDQGVQGHVIEKLRHLALTERAPVKGSACQQLWIYTRDRISVDLQQEARDSLDAGHCVCKSEEPVCH